MVIGRESGELAVPWLRVYIMDSMMYVIMYTEVR